MRKDQKILPKDEWATEINYDCGCCLKNDGDEQGWYVDNFCEDHDPTISNNGVND